MKITAILIFLSTTFAHSQTADTIKKSNPILFADISIGLGRVEKLAYISSLSLNYQFGNNLLTARLMQIARVEKHVVFLPIDITTFTDHALMYGKRYITDGESFSFSAGISLVNKSECIDSNTKLESAFFGVPFELNYIYFNKKRAPYRIIYGLIPIGKPIAFGRSIGFKFYGTISKSPVFGIGVSTSIGWHKHY